MATTINLKIKETKNGETTTSTKPFEIEDIDIFQFQKAVKVIRDSSEVIAKNKKMMDIIKKSFTSITEKIAPKEEYMKVEIPQIKEYLTAYGIDYANNAKKEKLVELLMKADQQEINQRNVVDILPNINEIFEVLLVELPDQAIEILAILSGIEKAILGKQKFIEIFTIFDAVVAENDIERVVERAKKSLEETRRKMGFLMGTKEITK